MNNQQAIVQRTNVLTVALCVLGTFCEGMDLQAAGVAAGGIGAEFKPLAGQMGNFFSASTLGLFFGAMLGGKLSDRFGRKNSLIISVVLFGLFSLLTAQAWDMTSLIWARLLTGLGLGGAMPNLIALVAESSGEHRRSANVALVYGGTPLGGALVSAISLVNEPAQWRWIFIAGGIVPLLVAAVMLRYMRESDTFTNARATVAAQPRAAGVIHPGSFLAVVSEGRAVRSTVLWIAFFIGLIIMYLLLNWLPTLMTDNGLSPAQAATAQIGFNVGGALAAVGAGHLFEGAGRRPTVVVASIALPLLLAWLATAPAQVMLVSIIILLIGCAIMAVHAFLYAAAPACYPTLIRGAGVGLAVAIGRIGSIVGPKWGGMLKDAGYNSSHLLMSIVPIALLAAVATIILLWMVPRVANGGVNSVTH